MEGLQPNCGLSLLTASHGSHPVGPRKQQQICLAVTACASRGLAAALSAPHSMKELQTLGRGSGPKMHTHTLGTTGGHGRASQNTGHLTTALASGLSNLEEGTESLACTTWTKGYPSTVAGLGAAKLRQERIVGVLGALVAGHLHYHYLQKDNRADSDRKWPYVLQACLEN